MHLQLSLRPATYVVEAITEFPINLEVVAAALLFTLDPLSLMASKDSCGKTVSPYAEPLLSLPPEDYRPGLPLLQPANSQTQIHP